MSKTPKGMRLASALRIAREERHITLRDLGERTGRNSGALSRYETGDRTPKPEDVAQILTAMGVVGDKYNEIMSLANDTDAPGWVAWSLPEQRQHLAAMVDAEQSASEIQSVAPSMFPGLLQSKEYTTAIMSGGGVSADEIVTRVAIRLGRRDVITKPDPATLIAYVGEAALYWLIGGPRVMLTQLRYVLDLSRRPNIHLHVTPFSSGWQPGLEGAFETFDSVVHIENRRSGVFLHGPDDVGLYVDAANSVRRASCDETESRKIITARITQLEKVS